MVALGYAHIIYDTYAEPGVDFTKPYNGCYLVSSSQLYNYTEHIVDL